MCFNKSRRRSAVLITEAYKEEINGVIGCYDRVIIRGTNGRWGYPDGMTSFFFENEIKIFDFAKVFTPITEVIKENAEKLAEENEIKIEYIRNAKAFRKDDRIEEILSQRGTHDGLVHIFSALETSKTYQPWHNKQTNRCYFLPDNVKCLHYYFYFIDRELGLCFFKVATTAPFQVMFYFNGHNYLASKLRKKNIGFDKKDNAFLDIADFKGAQELSDNIKVEEIHTALDVYRKKCLPLPENFSPFYNWTIQQVEYSLDISFKSADTLKPLYDNIIKTAMHTVTPDNIANFLGKRFSIQFEGEAGSQFNKRILGTRIKHQMGEISLKIYDKFGKVLRIEVTSNDVSQLRIHREVLKRDGSKVNEMAAVKKSIYSLFVLTKVFRSACNRYLEFISSFDDPSDGFNNLNKVVEDTKEKKRNYKGFNFFGQADRNILLAVADGKFVAKGITNKSLRGVLGKTANQVTRILSRLRIHGLIKKVGKSYAYHLTKLGRDVIVAGFKFIHTSLIPSLATA